MLSFLEQIYELVSVGFLRIVYTVHDEVWVGDLSLGEQS